MSEGIFINRVDFNRLVKKIDFLEEWVRASLKVNQNARWVSSQTAMEMLGVKQRKFLSLRKSGAIVWKTSGKGRNIMVSRESIEQYNHTNSNQI